MRSLGYLLVGHGTRDLQGQMEFLDVAKQLSQRAALPLEPCFLELCEPTIEQGLARLAERGVASVVIVPLLLFAAGHAKRDVPETVAEAAKKLGLMIVGQSKPLDRQPSLLELSESRVRETQCDTGEKTTLLVIGRGSSDPLAQASLRDYARAVAERLGVAHEVAFVAAAEPKVQDMLAELASRKLASVVVLPHLLFQGEVLATIGDEVEQIAALYPATRWHLAERLGPDLLVVEALLARMKEVVLVRRIISGGQTGVDRAALDAAIELGIEHGGWCPMKRVAEDGFIPARYALRQTESSLYTVRTERNVLDSDATLILCRGALSGGTALTEHFCARHGKPVLVIDLAREASISRVRGWLAENRIECLNVAGPRESTTPGIGAQAKATLKQILGEESM